MSLIKPEQFFNLVCETCLFDIFSATIKRSFFCLFRYFIVLLRFGVCHLAEPVGVKLAVSAQVAVKVVPQKIGVLLQKNLIGLRQVWVTLTKHASKLHTF